MRFLNFLRSKFSSGTTPPQQTIAEEAGLPDNWVPIDSDPIIPGQNNVPSPYATGINLSSGPLPPNFGTQGPALRETGYPNTAGPIPLMPVGPGGNPQVNSAIHSVAAQVVNDAIAAIPPTPPATNLTAGNGIQINTNVISLTVTERHYSPWVKSRQAQLEDSLRSAWEKDSQASGTT